MDGGILCLHVGSLIVLSASLEGPLPIQTAGGASVNDGIHPDEFTLHYISVNQVICMVSQFGKGALMAKFDIEAAYRNIVIHPANRYILA